MATVAIFKGLLGAALHAPACRGSSVPRIAKPELYDVTYLFMS